MFRTPMLLLFVCAGASAAFVLPLAGCDSRKSPINNRSGPASPESPVPPDDSRNVEERHTSTSTTPSANVDQAVADPTTVERAVAVFRTTDFQPPDDAKDVQFDWKSCSFSSLRDVDELTAFVNGQLEGFGLKPGIPQPTAFTSLACRMGEHRIMIDFLLMDFGAKRTAVQINNRWDDLDLPKLPVPEGGSHVVQRKAELSLTTPMPLDKAVSWYGSQMEKLGWSLNGTYSIQWTCTVFEKDGVKIRSQIGRQETNDPDGEKEPEKPKTTVNMTHLGNVDPGKLPKPLVSNEPPQLSSANLWYIGMSGYVSDAKLDDLLRACSDRLVEMGWRPVEIMKNRTLADRQLEFVWNGTLLTIEANSLLNDQTEVRYHTSLLPFDLIEAEQLRADSPMVQLFYVTSVPVQEVAEFYAAHLPKVGWKLIDTEKLSGAEHERMVLRELNYQPVMLDIARRGEKTQVEFLPLDERFLKGSLRANFKANAEPSDR